MKLSILIPVYNEEKTILKVLERIKEVTAKAYAVATKRKWLVFMIVAAIAAYLIIFKGGFDLGGIKNLLGF